MKQKRLVRIRCAPVDVMDALLYHGKEMQLDTYHDAMGIERPTSGIRPLLEAGRVVSVVLEPGDATRYTFILAPLLSHRLVYVTRLQTSGFPDSQAIGTAAFRLDGMPLRHDLSGVANSNEWTAELLAAFLNRALRLS